MRVKFATFSWGCTPSDHPTVAGTNHIHSLNFALLGFFPIWNNIFPVTDQCTFFFTYGLHTDFLMNVLKDYIIFIIWAAWDLLNFYLNQTGFHSGALLKMPSSFPSMNLVYIFRNK